MSLLNSTLSPNRSARNTTIAAAATLAFASFAGGALAGGYPQNLNAGQQAQLGEICQSTMGLKAWEAPSSVWGGAQDPKLEGGENHYQGCIDSLATALSGIGQAHAMVRADADCRARGYAEGSPALAECVLHAPAARVEPVALGGEERRAASSFYTASPGEIARREREACAAVGLNPLGAAFDNCVADMSDTFDRIDNPHY
jgi:hypothetical protein